MNITVLKLNRYQITLDFSGDTELLALAHALDDAIDCLKDNEGWVPDELTDLYNKCQELRND